MWYVPGLGNSAADACSRLTLRQLMDIENATPTRAFLVPLVENWDSPEGQPIDEFLHVLHVHDHLYVSLPSGCPVGKDPDYDVDTEPALQFDTAPAVEPEGLEQMPTNRTLVEDSHEPAARLDDAGNEVPYMSTDTDDHPQVHMDRLLLVTFGKEIRYAPTLTELIRYRRHRDGTL